MWLLRRKPEKQITASETGQESEAETPQEEAVQEEIPLEEEKTEEQPQDADV